MPSSITTATIKDFGSTRGVEASSTPRYGWTAITSKLLPGESRPDWNATITSSLPIQYVTQLSPSFGLFTLLVVDRDSYVSHDGVGELPPLSSSTAVVDVVVKLNDGWLISEIASIVSTLRRLQRGENSHNNDSNTTQYGHGGVGDTREWFRITVKGYVERMRARSARDACSPACLHAIEIQIEGVEDSNLETSSGPCGVMGTLYRARAINVVPWKEEDAAENKDSENCDIVHHSSSTVRPNLDSAICQPVSAPPCLAEGLTTTSQSIGNNWRGAKDATRFPKFVKFLLDTFGGYDVLSQRPVLDVAGGAGGLAFELSVRYAIDCIVVDTKPVKYNSKQLRHLAFRQQCVAQLQGHDGKSPLAHNLMNRFQVSDAAAAGSAGETNLCQYKTLLDSDYILSQREDRRGPAPIEGDTDHDEVDDRQRLRLMLWGKKCSVIVGLHPDQATDHIIDIGLALQIPWAVVPCCVFPNLFRGRASGSGAPVRTYDDLCDYILAKDPNGRIRQTTLPFRGRNKVFHWVPSAITSDRKEEQGGKA